MFVDSKYEEKRHFKASIVIYISRKDAPLCYDLVIFSSLKEKIIIIIVIYNSFAFTNK